MMIIIIIIVIEAHPRYWNDLPAPSSRSGPCQSHIITYMLYIYIYIYIYIYNKYHLPVCGSRAREQKGVRRAPARDGAAVWSILLLLLSIWWWWLLLVVVSSSGVAVVGLSVSLSLRLSISQLFIQRSHAQIMGWHLGTHCIGCTRLHTNYCTWYVLHYCLIDSMLPVFKQRLRMPAPTPSCHMYCTRRSGTH